LHRIPDDEREVLVRTVPVGHRGLGFGCPHDDAMVKPSHEHGGRRA